MLKSRVHKSVPRNEWSPRLQSLTNFVIFASIFLCPFATPPAASTIFFAPCAAHLKVVRAGLGETMVSSRELLIEALLVPAHPSPWPRAFFHSLHDGFPHTECSRPAGSSRAVTLSIPFGSMNKSEAVSSHIQWVGPPQFELCAAEYFRPSPVRRANMDIMWALILLVEHLGHAGRDGVFLWIILSISRRQPKIRSRKRHHAPAATYPTTAGLRQPLEPQPHPD